MIITAIDQNHIATVETEGQPTVPVYLNRPETSKLAFDSTKPPRGWLDIARTRRRIQRRKLKPQPHDMSGLDTCLRAGMEETLQAGVPKALNHAIKRIATRYRLQGKIPSDSFGENTGLPFWSRWSGLTLPPEVLIRKSPDTTMSDQSRVLGC
jgi:hypothetical protein